MDYIEIGEVKITDKYCADAICKALEQGGYKTALIYDTIGEQKVRILKERKD